MGAIFGIVYCRAAAKRNVEVSQLSRMGDSLQHRGKNGAAYLPGPRIGLGVRRWSEDPFAKIDNPPVTFTIAGRTLTILLDGEIYNASQLQEEVEDSDEYEFTTECHSEIIAYLYLKYGPERMFDFLRGKYAFAVWDPAENLLVLARDPLGQKPLYVYQDDEKVIFASEIKAILLNENIVREVLPTAIEDYFIMGAVPGERSIYRNIRKIMHGSWTTLRLRDDGGLDWGAMRRHWEFHPDPNEEIDPEEWEDVVQDTLCDTISMMKHGQSGAGAFLSGGLDSSIVVAMQSRLGCEMLPTFSIGFKEQAYNELAYAEAISDRFGTDMFQEIVEPDAVEELQNLVECFDEPYSDASALPSLLVSRLAAHHVSVVFSGDGGDECFAGYARQIHDLREDAVRQWIPAFLRKIVFGPLGAVYPKLDWMPRPFRLKTAFRNLSLSAGEAYVNTLSFCRNPLRQKLLAPLMGTVGFEYSDVGARYLEAFRRGEPHDTLTGMQTAEISVGLPEALVKVDRTSMFNGVEVRSPFLDTKVIELAGRIPSEYKIRDGLGKWILRETFEPQFPTKLKNRPKQGFELPTDVWLRGPLKEIFHDEVLNNHSKISRWVDLSVARRLTREHIQGLGNYGGILWSLLILEKWMQRWN